MDYTKELKHILKDYEQGQRIRCSEIYESFAARNGMLSANDKKEIIAGLEKLARIIWLKWDPQIGADERRAREELKYSVKIIAGDYVWNGPTVMPSLNLPERSTWTLTDYKDLRPSMPLGERMEEVAPAPPSLIRIDLQCAEDLKNIIFRVVSLHGVNTSYFYFDAMGVWRRLSITESMEYKSELRIAHGAAQYLTNPQDWVGKVLVLYFRDRRVGLGNFHDLASYYKMGVTKIHDLWEGLKLGEAYLNTKTMPVDQAYIRQAIMVDEIDRLIGTISRPIFDRDVGNNNKKTFDFIAVEVFLTSVYGNQTIEMIRRYKKKIIKRVFRQIANSPSFPKFGVTINMLQVKQATYNGNFISFTIELKPELQEMQQTLNTDATECFS